MEILDLYSLNKDMLVKLISTIQDNMKKEYEEKIRILELENEKLSFFRENCGCVDIDEECSFPGCPAFSLMDEEEYFKCESLEECLYCSKYFCNHHKIHVCQKELKVLKIENTPYFKTVLDNFIIEEREGFIFVLGVMEENEKWRPLRKNEKEIAESYGLIIDEINKVKILERNFEE